MSLMEPVYLVIWDVWGPSGNESGVSRNRTWGVKKRAGELESIRNDVSCIFAPMRRCSHVGGANSRDVEIEGNLSRKFPRPEYLGPGRSQFNMWTTGTGRELNKAIRPTVESTLKELIDQATCHNIHMGKAGCPCSELMEQMGG